MTTTETSATRWGHAGSPEAEGWSGAFLTREECAADGLKNYGGEPFWVCCGSCPSPSQFFPDADDVIEMAQQQAQDNGIPECAEDWPDVGREGRAELDSFLTAWAVKYAKCEFWIKDDGFVPERIPLLGAPATDSGVST